MKKLIVVLLSIIAICVSCINRNYTEALHEAQERVVTLQRQLNEQIVQINHLSAEMDKKAVLTHYEIAEEIYNVDKYLLMAIETLETGHFKSENYLKNNNTFGANVGNGYFYYDSHEQSTMELARLLRFSYFNKGLDTLEKINPVFCPTDSQWHVKVQKIYNELIEDYE